MNLNDIASYFDLQSARRSIAPLPQGGGGKPPEAVLPQYIALVAGIAVEPYLHHYIQYGVWSLDLSGAIGRVLFGLIVGAIAFPGIYKKAFDPDNPHFIQLCTIFAAGIGWQSLIQGGAKATLGIG